MHDAPVWAVVLVLVAQVILGILPNYIVFCKYGHLDKPPRGPVLLAFAATCLVQAYGLVTIHVLTYASKMLMLASFAIGMVMIMRPVIFKMEN